MQRPQREILNAYNYRNQLLGLGLRRKATRHQLVKNHGKHQAKRHAHNRIGNTQDYSTLESIDAGSKHQRAQTIHGGFISVVGAKTQAQPAQWSQQGMQGFRK